MQLLNDTLEMTRLVLESTKTNGDQLATTDKSLNSIGKEITTLNNSAEEILEQEKEHNEVLRGIQDNQTVVYEKNASLLETASDLTSVFENNTETLSDISQTITQGNQQDKEAKDAFILEMTKKNDTYGEYVGVLSEQMESTTNRLGELDTREELGQLLEQISNVSTSVKNLETSRNENQQALLEEFQKADDNIKSSLESLNELTEHSNALISHIQTAVSRIQTIDMKLDALSDDDTDDTDDSFDYLIDDGDVVDAQNTNTEGE